MVFIILLHMPWFSPCPSHHIPPMFISLFSLILSILKFVDNLVFKIKITNNTISSSTNIDILYIHICSMSLLEFIKPKRLLYSKYWNIQSTKIRLYHFDGACCEFYYEKTLRYHDTLYPLHITHFSFHPFCFWVCFMYRK